MIGGAGNLPLKMARTKSRPDIEAMTCVGVTPYSTSGASGLSCMKRCPASCNGALLANQITVIASEAKQSIGRQSRYGLLRYARNDGEDTLRPLVRPHQIRNR